MSPGTAIMYGVGETDWSPPPDQPFAPFSPADEAEARRILEGAKRSILPQLALDDVTRLRETAEAVVRWYADVQLLRRPVDRAVHSKPCGKLWEALRAMEWARCQKLPSVDDGALVTMWLYGKRERR